jgi:hypothetical protein
MSLRVVPLFAGRIEKGLEVPTVLDTLLRRYSNRQNDTENDPMTH